MPRPRLSHDKIDAIQRLRAKGMSIDKIEIEMEENNAAVSRGAVAKYAKEWDDRDEADKRLERRVDWNKLEDYGLPWESSSFLLEVWAEHISSPPTVRDVKWWWRLHLAAPDASIGEIWSLANTFVMAERLHDLQGWPVDWDGLWAEVAFRPWEDDERREAYLKAVADGHIPSSSPLGAEGWRQLRAMVATAMRLR